VFARDAFTLERMTTAKGKPLADTEREQLRAIVERDGERGALLRVRISRSALHRALAGLPVSEGTHAIVQRDLQTASLTA
jgi:hypothetical protein